MLTRSKSSAIATWYQPRLGSPIRFWRGMRTLSKNTSLVRPLSMRHRGRTEMPSESIGTRNTDNPRCFLTSVSVLASSQTCEEKCPALVNSFWPLMT